MKTRPWPIVVLALIQLLMPVFSLLANSWMREISPGEFARDFWLVKSWWEIAEFWLLFPLAGLAIFLMKKWSYGVFLIVAGWTIARNLFVWFRDFQEVTPPYYLLLFILMNIVFVGYYLLPAVRQVYFNRRLRWWESKPRFLIDSAVHLQVNGKTLNCRLRDLSEGGAFLELSTDVAKDREVVLELPILGKTVSIPGYVVHANSSVRGIGIRFAPEPDIRRAIELMVAALAAMGCDLRREDPSLWTSFVEWAKGAIRGQGLIPKP